MNRKDKLIASRWVPSGSMTIRPKGIEAVIYLRELNGKAHAVGYCGAAGKPAFNYSFKSMERCNAFLSEWVAGVKRAAEHRAKRRCERRAFVHSLKVGDVLSTSWGYDQTNVEFFEVVSLIGKSMVEVREIAQNIKGTGYMCGKCSPQPGKYIGKPLRKRVLEGNVLDIHGGFGYASPHEGREQYWSSYA